MLMQQVAVIILAAGFSRFFRSQKLSYLLEVNGHVKPLIVHALLPWLDMFEELTVVINADSFALRELVNAELTAQQAIKIN